MELIVFDDNESSLIDVCMTLLKNTGEHQDKIEKINRNIDALVELARAISQYPSILGTSYFENESQMASSLINQLCENQGIDKLMHVPTKAVLGKGFLIAKINFFYMLNYCAKITPGLKGEVKVINVNIANIIFTIMSEEVFLSIIEDKKCSEDTRNKAGFLLSNIWEYRLNPGGNEFAPILNSIWKARQKLNPVFGTMMGFSELYKMSEDINPVWLDFFQKDEHQDEVFEALEEFLFTLSYEEIKKLRQKMKEMGLRSVNKEKINELSGKKQLYPYFDEADMREMYRFYRNRKANAWFRKRANVDGPKNTIEQYIMQYLLQADDWIINL